MNRKSTIAGRFALNGVAAAALVLVVSNASALGLGRLAVQSALGESLRAEIDVTSITPEEASNLRVRIAPPESYRAAGVDYNQVLPGTQATLERRADGRPYLRITSDRAVQEPFVDVILELSWSTGRLVREYTLLFDPPTMARAPAPAAATTAPVIAAAPPAAPARPEATPRAEARRPAAAPQPGAPVASSAPKAMAADMPEGADQYKVKQGDTLSRIASRTQRQGVSLDQMLVSLFRGNPQAFVDNNMNRLKSGVVLAVPSADDARSVAPAEARQIIQAQSADFGAYRERLAGAVGAAKVDRSSRQDSGKVQGTVEDRKQAAAPSPDKLTLSKGDSKVAAARAEEAAAKEREARDLAARKAEQTKNIEELRKLNAAASAAKVAAAPPPAPIPVPPAKPVPTPVVPPPPPAPVPPPAPAVVPPAPAVAPPAPAVVPPAAVSVPAPVSVPVQAPAVVAAASVPATATASAPVVAAASKPAAPVAAKPAAVAAPSAEPGLLGSLMDDNPMALVGGGALIALLAGFGIYRFTRRAKKDSGETSFLESRLQPDSFFGASGGQRIDTRDAGGASSSMSYSLSQLDAIGDVDPVAEADVYLAYGRDLQAEEILKEAMRSTPERMAIRTKLLEVYAKRRDTKGFELLATQLFALTKGEGEDWAKAQELGRQVDSDNPLYQPGGMPAMVQSSAGQIVEPLGASTMPQSVLPSPSQFGSSVSSMASDSGSVDLDLDLDLDSTMPGGSSSALEATQALPPNAITDDYVARLKAEVATPAAPQSVEFDLSGISLDLDLPTKAAKAAPPAVAPSSNFGSLELPDLEEAGAEGDPFERKLELAEEFRHIGDMEGARDLLQEVVAKSSGAVRAKAQGMLDTLG